MPLLAGALVYQGVYAVGVPQRYTHDFRAHHAGVLLRNLQLRKRVAQRVLPVAFRREGLRLQADPGLRGAIE